MTIAEALAGLYVGGLAAVLIAAAFLLAWLGSNNEED